jgi:hypothetical protein
MMSAIKGVAVVDAQERGGGDRLRLQSATRQDFGDLSHYQFSFSTFCQGTRSERVKPHACAFCQSTTELHNARQ